MKLDNQTAVVYAGARGIGKAYCEILLKNFLNVPKFQPTIHKSTKQFGFSFTFDAPTIWNSLPEDIRASPTIATFRKKLKTYLYAKAYPP